VNFMRRIRSVAFVIVGLCLCPLLGLAQDDSFTVADSIQMIHFDDPDALSTNPRVWNTSPDGSTAILVTTKGIVASDVVESTLWTLDLRSVAKYLEQKDGGTPPSPKPLFTVRGQLRANQAESYGSLITNSSWAPDAMTIYALVEQEGGRRELDRLDVTSGREGQGVI